MTKSRSIPVTTVALSLLVTAQLLLPAQSSGASVATNAESQEIGSVDSVAFKTSNDTSYDLADVAKHNTRTDCWTMVNEVVYNITLYVNSHPGGSSAISKICGVNGTAIFNNIHGGSATQADILAGYKIGVLAKPVVRTCTAGNFFSTALSKCTPAPKGYFVSATSAAAGVTSATACPSGYTTLTTASTKSSDCYKPIAQTITGFSAPKAMKYRGTTNLPITTNSKAIATFKISGPCTARATTVTTQKNGQSVTTKVLKVTAASRSGTCKITLTSLASGKYLGITKPVQISISKTGK